MKFSLKSGEWSRKTRNDGILDCAHVKSALPFHIRENLTGQGFLIWEFGKRSSKLKGGISLPILAQGTFR
jgi:hypothetical protein